MQRLFTSVVAAVLFTTPLFAATQTATLKVPGMTCSACPITVKKALSKVNGVEKVHVSFEKKEAVVTFDDMKTNEKALVKATTDVGYPSECLKGGK